MAKKRRNLTQKNVEVLQSLCCGLNELARLNQEDADARVEEGASSTHPMVVKKRSMADAFERSAEMLADLVMSDLTAKFNSAEDEYQWLAPLVEKKVV